MYWIWYYVVENGTLLNPVTFSYSYAVKLSY